MVLLPSFFKILAYFNAYKLNDNEPWMLPHLFFLFHGILLIQESECMRLKC